MAGCDRSRLVRVIMSTRVYSGDTFSTVQIPHPPKNISIDILLDEDFLEIVTHDLAERRIFDTRNTFNRIGAKTVVNPPTHVLVRNWDFFELI